MISIRGMTTRDLSPVLQLNLSGRPGVAALDEQELGRLLALPNEHLVATEDNCVLGYLLAFNGDAPYEGEEFRVFRSTIAEAFIYIDQVAVAPAHSRRGAGLALYRELERAAVRQGIRVLCCEVNTRPPNPGSLSFHRKLGFASFASLAVRDGRQVELLTKGCGGETHGSH